MIDYKTDDVVLDDQLWGSFPDKRIFLLSPVLNYT